MLIRLQTMLGWLKIRNKIKLLSIRIGNRLIKFKKRARWLSMKIIIRIRLIKMGVKLHSKLIRFKKWMRMYKFNQMLS